MYKEIFNAVAMILTFIAFFPYIRSILKNEIKPHMFSWVIWGITTIIVFFAQLQDGAGIGAWSIGLSGIITLYIAFLAYSKKSDLIITKMDWCFFIVAIASIPFWYFTSNPLWAVVILTTVDILGFGPTIRHAYLKPFEENLTFYFIFAIRNFITIPALEHFSTTTILFPATVGIACLILVIMIAYRRGKEKKNL